MSCTYDKLLGLGFLPEQDLMVRSELVVKEHRAIYRLKGLGQASSSVFGVDNYIVTQGCRCDKLLLVSRTANEWVQYFVELKGGDIEHAVKQIYESVKNPIFQDSSNIKRLARIVSSGRIPSNNSNPTVERYRDKLRKEFNCELKLCKSNNPECFSEG